MSGPNQATAPINNLKVLAAMVNGVGPAGEHFQALDGRQQVVITDAHDRLRAGENIEDVDAIRLAKLVSAVVGGDGAEIARAVHRFSPTADSGVLVSLLASPTDVTSAEVGRETAVLDYHKGPLDPENKARANAVLTRLKDGEITADEAYAQLTQGKPDEFSTRDYGDRDYGRFALSVVAAASLEDSGQAEIQKALLQAHREHLGGELGKAEWHLYSSDPESARMVVRGLVLRGDTSPAALQRIAEYMSVQQQRRITPENLNNIFDSRGNRAANVRIAFVTTVLTENPFSAGPEAINHARGRAVAYRDAARDAGIFDPGVAPRDFTPDNSDRFGRPDNGGRGRR